MAQQPEPVLYVNGEFIPANQRHVSALDRGYTLGDGVFETIRAYKGGLFRLNDHLERLRMGLATLHLLMPLSHDQMREALFSTLERNGVSDAVLRITVSRGRSLQRGLLPPPDAAPTVVMSAVPFASFPECKYRSGFRVVVSSIRRNETSPTSYIKSLNYMDNILARVEAASQGADDAIRLNGRGYVTCATTSNVFLVRSRNLITPSTESGILAGITRATVLRLAVEMGIRAQEQPVTLRSLLSSHEVILTNSVMGLMPVVVVGDRTIGNGEPGQLCERLSAAYRESFERYTEYKY